MEIRRGFPPEQGGCLMRKDILLPLLALAGGGVGFGLRFWQNASAFDHNAMLFQEGAPATLGMIAALIVLAAITLVLLRGGSDPKEYDQAFSCPSALYMTLMTAGGFLLLASAGLGAMEFMKQMELWKLGAVLTMPIMLGLAALLCLPAGVGTLLLGKGNYRGALPGAYPLLTMLPAYALLPWLVALYQENSRQPETMLFLFSILGVVFGELGLYLASCFAFGRPHPKLCLFCSVMGTVLLLTTLADRSGLFSAVLSMAIVLLLLAQTAALARNTFGPDWPINVSQNESV